MAGSNAITAYARRGEALDALIWRELGAAPGPGFGVLEAVLAANPGLARLSLALPEGQAVFIPSVTTAPVEAALVQLWD